LRRVNARERLRAWKEIELEDRPSQRERLGWTGEDQEDTACHELAVVSRISEPSQLAVPFDGVPLRMAIERIVLSAEESNDAHRWIKGSQVVAKRSNAQITKVLFGQFKYLFGESRLILIPILGGPSEFSLWTLEVPLVLTLPHVDS
jgi:hypothetical protein